MKTPVGEKLQKLYKFFEKYMLFVVIILVGALMIFWPEESGEQGGGSVSPADYPVFSLSEMEEKLAGTLRQIQGAGRVEVLLSLKSDMEVVLAKDTVARQSREMEGGELRSSESENTQQTVITGSSSEASPVVTQRIYPLYRGALIVCDGGSDARVRLAVLEAVAALTGLGSDAISVLPMEP